MEDSIDARAIWQAQPAQAVTPGDISEKASTLAWETRRRALSGYGWASYFVLLFGWNFCYAANAAEHAGNLLCAAGAIIMAACWRYYRAAPEMPNGAPVLHFLAAYRAELVRQQRATWRIGLWSMLPLISGILLTGAGHLAARHALHGTNLAVLAAFAALLLGVACSFTALAAQQLQFRIDEVDAALRERPEKEP
jgi:hypothetical protein